MLNLKFEREKARLTQQELADMVNVHKMTIHYIEKEKVQPSLKVLRKLSEVLNVSIDDIVRRV